MTTATAELRATITGLISLAAAEEEMLLAGASAAERGGPDCWAALPLVAHNAEFRQQQVIRLQAVARGQVPPNFPDIDHRSPPTYQRYRLASPGEVTSASRQSVSELTQALREVSDDDLRDTSRHPWLRGRQLWLQVVVRGFWHPSGHIGDYHISHGRPGRAVALHSHGLITARYLGAPDLALGMAAYSLACASARAGAGQDAIQSLTEALALNPALHANAKRDPDLAELRDSGQLEPLLTSAPGGRR